MTIKRIVLSLMLIPFLGCENVDDFSPSSLIELMELRVRNDNSPADGISRITVVASFDKEFATEDDQKIDFVVFKDSLESNSQDLVFTSNNGIEQRISEMFIVHNKAETLQVKATGSVNGAQFSKTTSISFENAYPENINVSTDSLTINPNSFKQLKISTQLSRAKGKVNAGNIAETQVVDTLGNSRGLFNDYQNVLIDINSGIIENKFTLGNDGYEGKLYIISTVEVPNEILKDSIVIYSKK